MHNNPFLKIFIICAIFFQTIVAQDTLSVQIENSYIDGIDLGKKLNLKMNWQSSAEILQIENSSWANGNAWVSTKDTSFLLPAPVKNKWLPFPQSLQIFEKMLNKSFEYDSTSKKIIVKPLKDLYSVNLESKSGGEVLEIKLSKTFKAESFYSKPNYILRINGLTLDSAMFADLAKKSSLVSRVIPIQDAQSAQLTLVLKDNCEGAELVKKDGGKILQIVMRKKGETPRQATPATPLTEGKNTKNNKIKTIVIDPGHGGKDPGAIGPKKLQEKDVVLSVGLKLKKKLEAKGFTVKMTRDKDNFVELSKRPKMASDWGGDLFISLHCNAIDGKEKQLKTEGFKFYILRASGDEDDKAIARRENQAISLESGKKNKAEISAAEWIVLDNQLALYAERSALLAGYLVESYDGGKIKKQSTGAGQAGFYVLVGAYMPAVLAELGFITNPKDAEYMATDKGQNELAERLSKAIGDFGR